MATPRGMLRLMSSTPIALPAMPATLRCPRCGYDLRGVVESWTSRCPLDGTCSECGYLFAWVRLLQPNRFTPEWSVEYGETFRGRMRRMPGTFARTLRSGSFWRRIAMWHAVRLSRVAEYAFVVTLAILIGGYVLVQASAAVRVQYLSHEDLDRQVREQEQLKGAYEARLRRQQSALAVAPNEAERARLQQEIAATQQSITGCDVLIDAWEPRPLDYVGAVGEALFLPFADETRRSRRNGSTYHPPRDLHRDLHRVDYRFGSMHSVLLVEVFWRGAFVVVAASAAWFVLFPSTLLILVQTRRRTKLLAAHLARITLYGLPPVLFLQVAAVCFGFTFVLAGAFDVGRWEQIVWWSIIALVGWQLAWWAFALHRYGKLPNVVWIMLLHGVMCALFIVPLMVVLVPLVFIPR